MSGEIHRLSDWRFGSAPPHVLAKRKRNAMIRNVKMVKSFFDPSEDYPKDSVPRSILRDIIWEQSDEVLNTLALSRRIDVDYANFRRMTYSIYYRTVSTENPLIEVTETYDVPERENDPIDFMQLSLIPEFLTYIMAFIPDESPLSPYQQMMMRVLTTVESLAKRHYRLMTIGGVYPGADEYYLTFRYKTSVISVSFHPEQLVE